MWKCPHCEEEIDSLSYSVATTSYEYGSASLAGCKREDYISDPNHTWMHWEMITDHSSDDYGDTNWDGDCEYRCPECDNEISDIDSLIWIGISEQIELKKEKEPEETLHKIIPPKNYIVKDEISKDATESSIICKHCFHIFVHDIERRYREKDEKDFCECPKCGEQNSPQEFKELLAKGFFSNNAIKIKKNATKKTKHRSKWTLGKLRRKVLSKISGSK